MPCYHPRHGYRAKAVNPSGKRSIVWSLSEGYKDLPVTIRCGQCIDCRLNKSRQWGLRCVHESKLYDHNAFITLTYDDKNLPPHGTLVVKDFQDFMKRLRKKISSYSMKKYPTLYKNKIRYFHCGEYGEERSRPHYHACIFNFDFPDKYYWKMVNAEKYYRSPMLEALWGKGNAMTGSVTFESAAYVARYITKKLTGKGTEIYYDAIDEETGEIFSLQREYATMSRRKGIGYGFWEKFKKDLFPSDFVVHNGKRHPVPRFYDNLLKIEDPELHAKILAKRKVGLDDHQEDLTPQRLQVREDVQIEKFKRLRRELFHHEY